MEDLLVIPNIKKIHFFRIAFVNVSSFNLVNARELRNDFHLAFTQILTSLCVYALNDALKVE